MEIPLYFLLPSVDPISSRIWPKSVRNAHRLISRAPLFAQPVVIEVIKIDWIRADKKENPDRETWMIKIEIEKPFCDYKRRLRTRTDSKLYFVVPDLAGLSLPSFLIDCMGAEHDDDGILTMKVIALGHGNDRDVSSFNIRPYLSQYNGW